MADSMSEYLKQDMACEGLLECVHGLKELDKEIFGILTERADPMTVDEIADDMQRMLNDWYAEMGQLIGEFREKYDDASKQAATAES